MEFAGSNQSMSLSRTESLFRRDVAYSRGITFDSTTIFITRIKEFHQIREPSGLYNGFYCSEFPPDYPKIEEMVRTKKLRRGLALAHLSLALSVHEVHFEEN